MWWMITVMRVPGSRSSERKIIAVLTGAGISAESGLSTFRGMGGLWENERIEDVATPGAWKRDPDKVNRFYDQRRAQAASAQPNAAHRALAELESGFDVIIITQNVDDLHERGGSSTVLHLHGRLDSARCEAPEPCRVRIGSKPLTERDVCSHGYRLRPDIVWFGEAVPLMDEAVDIVSKADHLIIVGTSLQVYPAAGLALATAPHTPIHVIDPEPNLHSLPDRVELIRESASIGTPKLVHYLLTHHV
jgi:NAD-dependent deacetylase